MSGNLLELFRTVANLKRTPRTGWLDRGVVPGETESVADHTFMTALIGWVVAHDNPVLDADRVLKLGLIHDLAESIVGDRPPYEPREVPVGDPEAVRAFFSVRRLRTPENTAMKHRDEAAAADRLISLMPPVVAQEIGALWREYEAGATPEARFVKNVDTLEAFLQSRVYLRDHPDLPMDGFRDMAMQEIDDPALAALRDAELADDVPRRAASVPTDPSAPG